jgi:S1-C subfamily serine protease
MGGVLLRGVVPTSPAAKLLRRGDVLLQLDGHDIAHDGSFAIGGQVRRAALPLIAGSTLASAFVNFLPDLQT